MFLLLSRAADLQCYDKITQSTQQRSALLRIEKYIDVRHATLDKSRAERGVHVYWQIAYNCSRIAQSETSENVLFGGKIFVDLGAREKLTLSLSLTKPSHKFSILFLFHIELPFYSRYVLAAFFLLSALLLLVCWRSFRSILSQPFSFERKALFFVLFSRPPIFSYTRSCITNIISHAGFDWFCQNHSDWKKNDWKFFDWLTPFFPIRFVYFSRSLSIECSVFSCFGPVI